MSKVDLASLAADPARVEAVDPAALPDLIGQAEALRARLLAAMLAAAQPAPPAPLSRNGAVPDRLLSAEDVAERLGVDRRWVYRHADKLQAVRLSEGTLRFRARDIERHIERGAA